MQRVIGPEAGGERNTQDKKACDMGMDIMTGLPHQTSLSIRKDNGRLYIKGKTKARQNMFTLNIRKPGRKSFPRGFHEALALFVRSSENERRRV
jgi:hypothetical protein